MSRFRSINNNERCKNNTVAAKRLVKVQKSKNTFPPNGPTTASVFPSDAKRLGLSSQKERKERERDKRAAKAFCLRVASGRSREMEE